MNPYRYKGWKVVQSDIGQDMVECLSCHHEVVLDQQAMRLHNERRIPHAGVLISECDANRISADGP